MPRRSILTKRQQARLLDLPTDPARLQVHYTLDDFDLEQIKQRRRPLNKMGFALQLCALRYPGRLLAPGETIPVEVLRFLADQIGIAASDLAGYAAREETRTITWPSCVTFMASKALPVAVQQSTGNGFWIKPSMPRPIWTWRNASSPGVARPRPSCQGSPP